MAPLLLELSSLEIEPLEMTVNAPKQERSLDTLADGELAALLASAGDVPMNNGGDLCNFCAFPLCGAPCC